MSRHMARLRIGDTLEFKGPFPTLLYEPNKWKEIGMIAGGTGITPCLQVIEAILSNPLDKTRIRLLYANKTAADILMRERLDSLPSGVWNSRVRVTHAVENGATTRHTDTVMTVAGPISWVPLPLAVPTPSDDSLILVCGPPGFMKEVCGEKAEDGSQGEVTGMLQKSGYDKTNVYKF